MIEVVRCVQGDAAEILQATDSPSDWMGDWLIDQDLFIRRIEKTEHVIDHLLNERAMLLNLIRNFRLWANELVNGEVTPIELQIDWDFLDAIKILPDHLQKEILNTD